uniref:NADH-ubiquinone oxidoreductase chain 4 n=1 Tax=Ogmocotyle sikae TaxID=1179700 RepID=A0A0F7G6A5_9TREM|nr:NADH dehydrogenase subunit 4 [Ogmocotyle sikae]AKG49755.1 NADH dehydrogenase subunit 4 [Ogmocotyle sikae]
MGLQKFDWYSGCVGFVFFSFCMWLWFGVGFSSGVSYVVGLYGTFSSFFCFDSVSFYLCLLSVFLWISLVFVFTKISWVSTAVITLSVVCSLISYCCVHALMFWVFYELSILCLLLLLVIESPYSERYIASWYLLGYVVLTSLPMLLCLFYFSFFWGSYNISFWFSDMMQGVSEVVVAVLGVMFITKIPLPPFHVWLPIVHAEASSAVSVCLSGYIMKLGVLGVCRFCCFILPYSLFFEGYVIVSMLMSVLFFFSATRELDGKRWLAFMSLSHMIIVSVCLCVVSFEGSAIAFLFSLGHGLSAGVTFVLLWMAYDVSGSRNWNILKFCLSSSLLFRCLTVGCLCTVASLPPTMQFFSEVFVLCESGPLSLSFVYVFFMYLFCSGLVPLFFIGGLLTRHYNISLGVSEVWVYKSSILFLVIWSFIGFMVV